MQKCRILFISSKTALLIMRQVRNRSSLLITSIQGRLMQMQASKVPVALVAGRLYLTMCHSTTNGDGSLALHCHW